MVQDITDYIEPVYDLLCANAGKDDDTGRLVTHVPIHPWLVDKYDLSPSEAQSLRTRVVKELEAQGRVRRDNPRTVKVWVF